MQARPEQASDILWEVVMPEADILPAAQATTLAYLLKNHGKNLSKTVMNNAFALVLAKGVEAHMPMAEQLLAAGANLNELYDRNIGLRAQVLGNIAQNEIGMTWLAEHYQKPMSRRAKQALHQAVAPFLKPKNPLKELLLKFFKAIGYSQPERGINKAAVAQPA